MPGVLDLLSPETILPRAKGGSRKLILSELSGVLSLRIGADASDILTRVLDRERMGSTGVGEGVAIPHARIPGLDRIVAGFARLEEPADFDAIDGHACDLIFMILAPDDVSGDHLRALAKVSRLMRQESVRKALRAARSVDAVIAALSPPDNPESDAA